MRDKNGVLLKVGDMVLLEDILRHDSDHRYKNFLCNHLYMVDGFEDRFIRLAPMFHSLHVNARTLLLFKDCAICSIVGGCHERG